MARWTAFPHDASTYRYDAQALERHWPRLHAGDAEPLPADPAVCAAWALFHAGDFEAAVEAGMLAGGAGITVANKAQAVYATYLETSEQARPSLFMEVASRAEAQIGREPGNANAHYFMAYGLARYGQGISIGKALAQGLGGKVRSTLEAAIRLQPAHADAHAALGAFHAEVIDQVGALLGRAQGASKDAGVVLFKTALRLNPTSAITRVEYANGLAMLEGDPRMHEATRLYEEAAASEPLDATERLGVEMARLALAG